MSQLFPAEISTPPMRGTLGFLFQAMLTVGILFASLLGLGLDWRWISAILAVFPLISVVSMIFVPESPYYSFKKGAIIRQYKCWIFQHFNFAHLALYFLFALLLGFPAETAKSLVWLRGSEYNIGPEMNELNARLEIELAQSSSFIDLFKPWALKPALVVIGLMFFQQFSGINAALFNAVAIFSAANSSLSSLVSAVLLNVDQVELLFQCFIFIH